MESNRKRKSGFMKGNKLVMSFYRTPPAKPNTSVQYSASKVKPSPPPPTTTVGFLVDQEFVVPSSFVKSDGGRDTKNYVDYNAYYGTGDESVDMKAASYISHVQARFRLERVDSERRNYKDMMHQK
ncbi:hypothetical protein IFM89_006457 [Coptis chinensis]|uniref:Uncharacterized protein n=1 Tax=Coptis chinensis TaxID=261450 RepID=A0A835M4V9_9MAGN|nr:hypothetical protein IFM89_006457 [Coptis chinensis]